MCGLVGQFGCAITQSDLERARDVLRHRGPDDVGFAAVGPVSLGFRRLSILDLSPAGHQPMTSHSGKTIMVLNGEIYNYLELREELKKLGRTFTTQSDTEVVLEAYEAWGLQCFEKMNGMWAIALWDNEKQQLILSRDRFGEKPLYWHKLGTGYIFGSEIKTILALGVPAIPYERMVCDYLVYAYLDHTDQTMYQDIFQVLPGTVMLINALGARTHRYWKLLPKDEGITDFDQAARRFRELLTDSIRLRLRSDVPVGSCLSGGLDSSSIVMLADQIAKQQQTKLEHKTFTAVAADPKYDERQFSRLINQQLGQEQSELEPDPQLFRKEFDTLLWHQDEPFLSMSMFAQWSVMRRVHERGVTVILDGQGGDEILAGYMPYFGSWLAQLIRQGRWVTAIREWRAIKKQHARSLPDILPSLALYLFPNWVSHWLIKASGKTEIQALQPEFRRKNFRYPVLPRPFRSQLKNHLYRLLTGPGLRALLHSEDRNSMAFSVEARVPFLDHRLAEFTLGLPEEFLLGQGQTKRLLRAALHDVLPAAIRDRGDKMGFVVPQADWMRTTLGEDIKQALLAPKIKIGAYLDLEAVRRTTTDFLAGRNNQTALVWRWYNLEHWLQRLPA